MAFQRDLYLTMLFAKKSTIKAKLAQYNNYNDPELELFEAACGLLPVPRRAARYDIFTKFVQFCANTWMRLFRKNVVRLLLTKGCVPHSKETQDYCKPILEALLEKYHNIHPLSSEKTSRQATLLQTAKTLQWNNIVQVYDQKIQNKPLNKGTSAPAVQIEPTKTETAPPAQVEPIKTETAPSEPEPSAAKPSILPIFSSETVNGVPAYGENEQRNGGELRPHDPTKSTTTATSHYLNIKMVD